MRIILGSRSEGRKKVLQKMGYDFEIMPADIDEKAIRYNNPKRLVLAIGHAKATAIMPGLKGQRSFLITSDQVVVCRGQIREKPSNQLEVFDYFRDYSIFPATTVTSVIVTETLGGTRVWGVDVAKIWFRPIPPEIVDCYIETGDPYLRAGGFDHEHHIINPYVDRIEGESESVTGLPLALTKDLLKTFW